MKKILLLAALIAAGYYIYDEHFSLSEKNLTLTDKQLAVKKLFDKVALTPVSDQEAKAVFKGNVIDICEENGGDTFGITDECINNFERLASKQCFRQLVDFEGKIYNSKRELHVDLLTFEMCALDIIREANFDNTIGDIHTIGDIYGCSPSVK
ncbi:hypothetical protein [Psychromonas sp. MME2]|uniref:hypothetical protein n=1 Tax=unclassified Psychromonas TaxID=2614957 RepID=UPI00339CADE4